MQDCTFFNRPRRSCLYMPANNQRALEKAKTINADTLVFDLEDAVPPEAKLNARQMAFNAVQSGGYGNREVVVRINGLDTDWGADDLMDIVASKPDGIIAPKVSSAEDVQKLDSALSNAGAPQTLALWVMIETSLSIMNLQEIAACVNTTRLAAFVAGTNDLAKDMRAVMTLDRQAFQPQLLMTVIAARAYGLVAIDGVFNDIRDADGLKHECRQGRIMGFEGKSLIHPGQVDICNQVFSPSKEDLAQAQDIIAAFAAPENAGRGVLTVNGKMTEILHLEEARRVVEVEKTIQSLSRG